MGEGQTLFQQADAVARYVDVKPGRLYLQYEGMNPSGSFKDNGMSAAFTHARMCGPAAPPCASTGNTSASLAMYCAMTRLMKAVIFIGSGKDLRRKTVPSARLRRIDRADRRGL